MRTGLVLAGLLLAGGMAAAQDIRVETIERDNTTITLRLHPFLTAEEVAMLRMVVASNEALAMFVPEGKGFAALAVSPREGFIRDGMPVSSAQALGGAATAGLAAEGAQTECTRLKTRGPDCVTILEVAVR